MNSHVTTISQSVSYQRALDATAFTAMWTTNSRGVVFPAVHRAVPPEHHRSADGDGH